MSDLLLSSAAEGFYWITRHLAIGRFATPARIDSLRQAGVRHLLNVAEAPPVPEAGTMHSVWHPVPDLALLPAERTIQILTDLHEMACRRDGKLYVHCIAGQNRSPTIAWLYFVACGIDADDARRQIESRMIDAVPGHATLADGELLEMTRNHGRTHFLPHPHPEFLRFT